MVAIDDHRAIATRMSRQGLRGGIGDIAAVVRSLVGMQSQEFGYALWSVAQRTAPGSDASHRVSKATMDSAFADGVLVRTHVLRLTWHFALPEDIRWLLRLTVPRLKKLSAYYDRQLGLDDAVFARTNAVLADAVSDGRHRTRAELTAVLDAAGIPASGQRAGNIMMRAEFDEVLISGAPRGKQQTYAAFDERVPPDAGFDADESLAELARRFFTTRGPATVKDLATWASLTVSQAKRGVAQVESELDSATLDGETVYLAAGALDAPSGEIDSPTVDLVQGYDEIVMSYSETRGLLAGGAAYLADRHHLAVPAHHPRRRHPGRALAPSPRAGFRCHRDRAASAAEPSRELRIAGCGPMVRRVPGSSGNPRVNSFRRRACLHRR